MNKPPFFEEISQRAARRWSQLEGDPDLAGPWHQLFRQVQSPRHVLSELLQNADDANATEASVRIHDGSFVFEHNGDDFSAEHFASLCRFGFSNKRALHTIGFRGIGFKSTFSLGNRVELRTPTLSVAFERKRFTEPKWVDADELSDSRTVVRIAIADPLRHREIEKNLSDWLTSPVSLLFFRRIRCLRIGTQEIRWDPLRAGPVTDSEWMALNGDPGQVVVFVRSPEEPFPEEVLAEIREERSLQSGEDLDFPPCRVEIVVGAKGRLFVVLPTEVEPKLPFACNAPFIQDPARLKIKDPETSPTNRWLLNRAGTLAATMMLRWLGHSSLDPSDRATAYVVMPDVDRQDGSLAGTCATTVEESFGRTISGKPILLTHDGKLTPQGGSVIVPDPIASIWPETESSTIFDPDKRPLLSSHASTRSRSKLLSWRLIEEISHEQVLATLALKRPPKPASWKQLMDLWTYVGPRVSPYRSNPQLEDFGLVPVQGQDVLCPSREVVRLGEKRFLQSDEDWNLVSNFLLILNSNWPRFIADQRREASERGDAKLGQQVEEAIKVLDRLGLKDASNPSLFIERVARGYFRETRSTIAEYVRIAQIAAKLGADVPDSFRFCTADRVPRQPQHEIFFDADGQLAPLFHEEWFSQHVLHPLYSSSFTSCTREEWERWAAANLHTFPPLRESNRSIWGRQSADDEIRRRGYTAQVYRPYVTQNYILSDWDFDEPLWTRWHELALADSDFWRRLVELLVAQGPTFWRGATSAALSQVATTGTRQQIVGDRMLPAWILKLRDFPCLPDTRETPRKPDQLLRRTSETESLIEVELFVHSRLDTEQNRPLLILLGVSDKPTGPERILGCLRSLAQANQPPTGEVDKWYRRLDSMIDSCSTEGVQMIKGAFASEKIILAHDGSWVTAASVFLDCNEDDAPGVSIVRASVREFALWRKVGVADRPTVDLAIAWLSSLQSGALLNTEDSRRVRALLGRHSTRIWNECGHWINLAGEWKPVGDLRHALGRSSPVTWSHLFDPVKQATADLRQLPSDIAGAPPFEAFPRLGPSINHQFSHVDVGPPEQRRWITQFGVELARIVLVDSAEMSRIQTIAQDLALTYWQATSRLETVPYIDGVPVGTQRPTEAIWRDRILYVGSNEPITKLARFVPLELGRIFNSDEIIEALKLCFDRAPEFVTNYLEENFTLAPRSVIGPAGVAEILSGGIGPNSPHGTSSSDDKKPRSEQEGNRESTDSQPLVEEHDDGRSNQPDEGREAPGEDAGTSEHHTPGRGADNAGVTPHGATDRDEHEKRQKPRVPEGPPLIARFALRLGYSRNGDSTFRHPDGSTIRKTLADRFPWELRSPTGDLVRCYWPEDHCVEHEPLEIAADVWTLLEQSPHGYSMILSAPSGEPAEYSGKRLRTMRENGQLKIHPASYRLVCATPDSHS